MTTLHQTRESRLRRWAYRNAYTLAVIALLALVVYGLLIYERTQ